MTILEKRTETRLAQFLICAGVVLFFVPLSLFATWQFTISGLQTDVNGGVTAWRGNGGAVLTPYHTETNGWRLFDLKKLFRYWKKIEPKFRN